MKKLIIILILLSVFVVAKETPPFEIAVWDKGTARDVLTGVDVITGLGELGYSVEVGTQKLFSDVNGLETSGKIVLAIAEGKAKVIIGTDEYNTFVNELSSVLTDYEIKYEYIREEVPENLEELFGKIKLKSVSEVISYIDNNFTSSELNVIYGKGDSNAFDEISSIFSDNSVNKYFFFSDEISNDEIEDKNLIIIGGPCANKFWILFSSEGCSNWPYSSGESVAKVVQFEDNFVVLIAGTDKEDTLALAIKVKDYSTNSLFDDELEVVFE